MTLDFDGVVLLEAAETASVTLTLGEMTGDVAEAETETATDGWLNVGARTDNVKTAPVVVLKVVTGLSFSFIPMTPPAADVVFTATSAGDDPVG
jgi:hypothetical protein